MFVNTLSANDEYTRHIRVILPLHTKSTTQAEADEMRSSGSARCKADKIRFKNAPALYARK